MAQGEVKGLLRRCTQQGGLCVVILDLFTHTPPPPPRQSGPAGRSPWQGIKGLDSRGAGLQGVVMWANSSLFGGLSRVLPASCDPHCSLAHRLPP